MKMKPFKGLISVQEALARVLDHVSPLQEAEAVPLTEALGRVVAEPVVARLDVPGFDRSAMDGYAVVAADTYGANEFDPVGLKLAEVLHAGEVPSLKVEPGCCTQIATGAMLPMGADGVVKVEETALEEDRNDLVKILKPVFPGQNISRRGGDIQAGTTVLEAGTVLTPAGVGVLASLGQTQARVYRRPKLAVLPTGTEVAPLGRPLQPGEVYNSNAYTLEALALQAGAEVDRHEVLSDELEVLEQAVARAARECDLVVLSGGSSVGERDLLVEVLEQLGRVLFHGVAVRPGKPVLFGLVGSTPVLGLPGYPTSCLTTGYIFLLPALARLAHQPPEPRVTRKALLTRRINSVYGRTQYHTVRLLPPTAKGRLDQAEPAFKESGAITSLANAHGFVVIPDRVDLVEAGEQVEVLLV